MICRTMIVIEDQLRIVHFLLNIYVMQCIYDNTDYFVERKQDESAEIEEENCQEIF